MWKSFALSLLTLSATTSFADSRLPPIKFKPLCNGHAGGCLPGEYDDALYPGATGNGLDPRERVGRAQTPANEVLANPETQAKMDSWLKALAKESFKTAVDIFFRTQLVEDETKYPTIRVNKDGFEFDGGFSKKKYLIVPPTATPSPVPGFQPGLNLFDSNGMFYKNIPIEAPIHEMYYTIAKLMNTESWFKPWRNTDGTVYMIHNYGEYCHVPNYDLTREVLKVPSVIMVRDPDMSLYQFTGTCEYPNRTGYNYGHGLWVKLNAYEYCETGWDWFETTGWPWHTVTDESFRTRGFGETLRNIGPCQR